MKPSQKSQNTHHRKAGTVNATEIHRYKSIGGKIKWVNRSNIYPPKSVIVVNLKKLLIQIVPKLEYAYCCQAENVLLLIQK